MAVRVVGERRPGWLHLPWKVGVIGVGKVLYCTEGHTLANGVTGLQTLNLLTRFSRQTPVSVLFALLPGTAFTWCFQARERVAAAAAQAQTAHRLAAENQLRRLQSELKPHILLGSTRPLDLDLAVLRKAVSKVRDPDLDPRGL